MNKFLNSSRYITFTLIFFAYLFPFGGCTFFTKPRKKNFFDFPKDYTSQRGIILQGQALIPTHRGDKPSVYFGYDRNRGLEKSISNPNNTRVDLVEYKLMLDDGSWSWEPILVFIDDNFDGVADRIFIDGDLNGTLDSVFDIKSKMIKMDEINFQEINPWYRWQFGHPDTK